MNLASGQMRKRGTARTFIAGCAALVLALAGCSSSGSGAGGGSTPGGGASVNTSNISAPVLDGLSGAERNRVASLIAQAKTESAFTWIDSVAAPATASAMMAAFEKEYGLSGVKLTYERLTSGELSSRIQQEVSAQKVKTDLFGVASPRLFAELKSANALMKYRSPEADHYAGAAKYVAEQPDYFIAPVAYAFGVIVNPKLYPKPVTSWNDLSDPALNGKFDVPNVAANEGSLYWYYGLRSKLPKSTFEAWAKNSPKTSTGSSGQEAQKVAQGQIIAAITSGFRASQTVAQTKVPLKVYYPSEGTPLSGQTYAIPQGAPHAAVAKLFEDWLLSKAGQQMYVEKEGIASFYPGVDPLPSTAPYMPSLSKMSIIPLDTDKISSSDLDKARTEWKSIFSR